MEEMDDDVARIHQHPIATLHPFDRHLLEADGLERVDHAAGERADMALRRAAGNHHIVSEIGFAVQVYGNNVFGFMCVEGGKDDAFEMGGRKLREYSFCNDGRSPFWRDLLYPTFSLCLKAPIFPSVFARAWRRGGCGACE